MSNFTSQYGQDEYLERDVFKGFKNGFFVDVGANDGVSLNSTKYFQETNGWTGINIEPLSDAYSKLTVNRPNDININCAVYSTEGPQDFRCNTGFIEMLSGLVCTYDPRHLERLHNENTEFGDSTQIITVQTQRLETIFDQNNVTHIHYLNIDVEGGEFDVIKSINFDKVFIDVIEFSNNFDDVSAPIIEYLTSKNYSVCNIFCDVFMIHDQSQFKA